MDFAIEQHSAIGALARVTGDAALVEPPIDPDLPTYESLTDSPTTIKPQTIHIDGVYVFPSEPPARALYQLSRDLIAGTRISIERVDHEIHNQSTRGPRLRIKDRLIYSFAHEMFDDSSIEIIGKRKDCFASVLMAKRAFMMHHAWTVRAWAEGEHMLLECVRAKRWLPGSKTPVYEWRDGSGTLLAFEDVARSRSSTRSHCAASPSLRIIEPLQQKMLDLLVTSWCARTWNQTLRDTGQIRTILKAKNAHFKE